jgi:hypothetical protein
MVARRKKLQVISDKWDVPDHDQFFAPKFLMERAVHEEHTVMVQIHWLGTVLALYNEPAVSDVSKLKRYNV